MTTDANNLHLVTLNDLRTTAKCLGIAKHHTMNKPHLLAAIHAVIQPFSFSSKQSHKKMSLSKAQKTQNAKVRASAKAP